MEIPLKEKYKIGFKSRYKGGERSAPLKHRKKIGGVKHTALYGTPRPKTRLVNALTGHSVMVYTDDLAN